jgi:hypothetical protein
VSEVAEDQTKQLMGIGPEVQLGADTTKTLRIGTIKQIREVTELYSDGLLRIKAAANQRDKEKAEEQTVRWVEILNIVLIEGFSREEFDDSIPEQMESAVEQFLFG